MGLWESIFWPLRFDFWASGRRISASGVDFGSLEVNCEPLGIDLGLGVSISDLKESMIGICESILNLWESILTRGGEFRLLDCNLRPLGVDYGPWKSIVELRIQLWASGS